MTPNLRSPTTTLTRKKRAVLSRHQGSRNSSKSPMKAKKLRNQKRKRKNDRGMSIAMCARMEVMSCAAMAATRSLTITALASSPNLKENGSARIA